MLFQPNFGSKVYFGVYTYDYLLGFVRFVAQLQEERL